MDNPGYLRVLRERFALIIVLAIIGAVSAFGIAKVLPPSYSAQATLFLKVQSTGTSLYERSQFALQRVQSYPQLLESPALLRQVIAELHLNTTSQELAQNVSGDNPSNTVLVNVTATASTADTAAAIANAAAAALSKNVDQIENGQTSGKNQISLVPQITAQAPQSPSSPNVPVIVGLGALSGIVLGYLLALLLETVRPRIRDAAEVREATGLPLVAQLPRRSLRPRARLQLSPETSLAVSDLAAITRGSLPPVLLLVPVDHAAGRPAVRYLLARALRATGRSVAVVESDPIDVLPEPIAVDLASPGLSELLAARVAADAVVRVDAETGVAIVPLGDSSIAPPPFEADRLLADTIEPIVSAHDATILQPSASGSPVALAAAGSAAVGAYLVVSRRSSNRGTTRRVLAQLRVLGIVPIGIILVDVAANAGALPYDSWRESDFVHIEAVAAAPRPAKSATSVQPDSITVVAAPEEPAAAEASPLVEVEQPEVVDAASTEDLGDAVLVVQSGRASADE